MNERLMRFKIEYDLCSCLSSLLPISLSLPVSMLWNRFSLRLRHVSCSSFMLRDGIDDVLYRSSSGFDGNTGLHLLVDSIESLLGEIFSRLRIRSVNSRRKSRRHFVSHRSIFFFSFVVHRHLLGDLPLPVQYDLRWLHPDFLLCLTNSEKIMFIALLRFEFSKLNFVSCRKEISTRDSFPLVEWP